MCGSKKVGEAVEMSAKKGLFWGLLLMAHYTVAQTDTWTWLYQKMFTGTEFHAGQHSVTFTQEGLPQFTQLMFSWNALRPEKGHYSFWVQSKDATTKKWSKWYKMIEWGCAVQRSFASARGTTRYAHVRLEMGNYPADAFRIKIYAHHGAALASIKSLFVALSDFRLFKEEIVSESHATLPSLHISGVPKKSQFLVDHPRNNAICSPTSCSMLLGYLLNQDINPMECVEKVYDTGLAAYGSWPFNIAYAFEKGGGIASFAVARMNSFEQLHQRLQKNIPVVVSVRGPLAGAAKAYEHGHLLVVVGYDAHSKQVICHDPAFASDDETLKKYDLQAFLTAWERSNRLAYIADLIS